MYITTEYLETKFREPSLLVYSGKGTLFIRSSNLLNNENNKKKKKPSILTHKLTYSTGEMYFGTKIRPTTNCDFEQQKRITGWAAFH